jgi:DNA mismatch repair protein MutS2
MSIPLERVVRVLGSPEPEARAQRAPVRVMEQAGETPGRECDLRGLRVDEALDRADAYLQRMLGQGEPRLILIHGHGTGALRNSLRAWLRERPEVADFGPGGEGEGGNGITFVRLTH